MAESQASSERARKKRGFFGAIIQFLREVVDQLKKVVTPSRKELINYTLVVLGFVAVMMVLVTILDFVFGKLAGFIFAGSPLWPLW
ncbi:preprotein translocase subunit SecE [Brevibacterium sp. HMSC063G07]|uniref:preprotein translocase subunit SecE n=1 Tax=Brevibacterium sp. HMSC063G07 TaxID=1739261 RepID=UPI0008A1C602|nr:preprotein translocase subunit SecE [Brevibacterium sp. HMSC063G07]OFL66432.1 preprotein translocase subunit SecE [Brevibacterium sp. HMSC063G07]